MEIFNKIGDVLKTDITTDFLFQRKTKSQADFEMTFVEQLKKRRSIYLLGKRVHHSQAYLAELIQESVRSCPSAYNCQSTRIVVLFNESHRQFWDLVKQTQKQHVPDYMYEALELKLKQCSNAFGTVLFYEDQTAIQQLQKQVPLSAPDFPIWSEQTSGMAQFAVWTSLADSGLGASLQHYNPIIDRVVAEFFNIPSTWKMRAQLCFGSIEQKVEEKSELDDQERFRIYV